MITTNEKGHVMPPDQTFAAYAAHKARQQKNKTVVTHVEASMCIEKMVEEEGGKVVRTKVGDISIAEAIRKHKATFGGEPCGAWIHPHYHYCPDGILSSILLLQALEEKHQKPSQLTSRAPTYPLLRQSISCPNQAKPKIMNRTYETLPEAFHDATEQLMLDGVRLTFTTGWLLIRPSGTESLVRITVEATTRKEAESIMKKTIKIMNILVKETNP